MTGPDLHELIDTGGVWEALAAVYAGRLSRAAATELLGLDAEAFARLLSIAEERMNELARRVEPVGV